MSSRARNLVDKARLLKDQGTSNSYVRGHETSAAFRPTRSNLPSLRATRPELGGKTKLKIVVGRNVETQRHEKACTSQNISTYSKQEASNTAVRPSRLNLSKRRLFQELDNGHCASVPDERTCNDKESFSSKLKTSLPQNYDLLSRFIDSLPQCKKQVTCTRQTPLSPQPTDLPVNKTVASLTTSISEFNQAIKNPGKCAKDVSAVDDNKSPADTPTEGLIRENVLQPKRLCFGQASDIGFAACEKTQANLLLNTTDTSVTTAASEIIQTFHKNGSKCATADVSAVNSSKSPSHLSTESLQAESPVLSKHLSFGETTEIENINNVPLGDFVLVPMDENENYKLSEKVQAFSLEPIDAAEKNSSAAAAIHSREGSGLSFQDHTEEGSDVSFQDEIHETNPSASFSTVLPFTDETPIEIIPPQLVETSEIVIDPEDPTNVSVEEEEEGSVQPSNHTESESDLDHDERPSKRRKATPLLHRSRKRQKNPSQWQVNIAKKAYRAGQEYVDRKGKVVQAKTMGPGCKSTCRYKCLSKVDNQNRQEIFNSYYQKVDSAEKSWEYICRHVKKKDRARIVREESMRKCSYQYFFRINGKEIKVCKTMFLSTLRISNTVIDTAFRKLGTGSTISPSKRGKHKHRKNAIQETLKQSVRDHINMFPKVESHYTRENSKREYLQEGLTIARMHREYCKWMKVRVTTGEPSSKTNSIQSSVSSQSVADEVQLNQENIPDEPYEDETSDSEPEAESENDGESDYVQTDKEAGFASLRQYRDIFNNEFNLGFHLPKKDECDQCVEYRNATPEEQLNLKDSLNKHIKEKEEVRQLKAKDKEDSKTDPAIVFACYDLQKVLYAPQGKSSVFFYKSKLSIYNFTIYQGGPVSRGFCYTWHEGEAKRGSSEIASCVLQFIDECSKSGVKEIRFYSDNCGGQNKNHALFTMYVYASSKFNVKITHRYLVKGHTQNEGDSMHARIELESRGKKLEVPSHWRNIMKNAKKTGEKYRVIKMNKSNIFSFKDLVSKFNWTSDENGDKLKFLSIKEIVVSGTNVAIKYDFSQEHSTKVPIVKRRGRPVQFETYALPLAYEDTLPIKEKKKK